MSLCGVRGEQHANHKLKEWQIRQIFKRANDGEKQEALAIEFGINQRTISAIKLGKRWKHLGLVKNEQN
jgi:hypothetical protein